MYEFPYKTIRFAIKQTIYHGTENRQFKGYFEINIHVKWRNKNVKLGYDVNLNFIKCK